MRMALRDAHHRPGPQLRGLLGSLGQAGCEWINQANGDPYWGCYVDANGECCAQSGKPCTSSYVGCAGGPPAAPATSPSNTAGQNILAENEEFAADPNLNSAAYLATQAAYTPGGVAPSAAADTLSELQTYCAQNYLNSQEFGDAIDSSTCENGDPLPSLIAQAAAVTPVSVVTGPPASVPAAQPAAPQSSQTTVPAAQPTNVVSSGGGSAPAGNIPAAAINSSSSTSGGLSASVSSAEDWFTGDTLIAGIPNWGLVLAGVALIWVAVSMGGRR
jgi:hypothetical protein